MCVCVCVFFIFPLLHAYFVIYNMQYQYCNLLILMIVPHWPMNCMNH